MPRNAQRSTSGESSRAQAPLGSVPLTQIIQNLQSGLQSVFADRSPSITLPQQILGGLRQQDGSAAAQLLIEVLLPAPNASGSSKSSRSSADSNGTDALRAASGSHVVAAGLTDASGAFCMSIPKGIVLPLGQSLYLRVRGGSLSPASRSAASRSGKSSSARTAPSANVVILVVPPSLLGPLGYVGTFALTQFLAPIPTQLYTTLITNGSLDGVATSPPCKPMVPARIKLGDDADCVRVIENQSSTDRFPYGIFFRLLAPVLFQESESKATAGAAKSSSPRAKSTNADPTGSLAVQRADVPVARADLDGPISVTEFRTELLRGPMIVGTVGLGYVLRCAQSWKFQGIALGDLVYSLPLAPGEQQQVVIVEQQTSTQVVDSETIVAEQQSQSTASSDSSTQAVFASTLNQFASGSSSLNSMSTTNSGATGSGLMGMIFGGSSTGTGTTNTTGTSSSSMNGVQNYASNAAQSMQGSAEQQAMVARRGQRTAIRAASASETTSVTTKTITNHNKLHALTLQYFEALRMFDISTAFENVTLLALVPLDIVWFLPPDEPVQLPDIAGVTGDASAIQIASTLANTAAAQLASLAQASGVASNPFVGLALVRLAASSLAAASQQLGNQATNLNNILTSAASPMAGLASDIVNVQVKAVQAAVTQYGADASTNAGTLMADLNAAAASLQNIQSEASTIKQQLAMPPSGAMTRQRVLARYAGLQANSDVLQRALPRRFLSGLTRLERFAADPNAAVALNSLAEDVIQISATASILPFDRIYVAVVTRWGSRLGPTEMTPTSPVTVPGQFDATNRFRTTQDLLQYLQGQRKPGLSGAPTLQAAISLPRTLAPSDVVGFEITHTTDSFTYQIAAPVEIATSILGSLFGPNGSSWPAPVQSELGSLLGPVMPTPSSPPPATYVTYTANDIATNVGPPSMWNFGASLLAGVQGNNEPYVNATSNPIELPPSAYPIPAAEVSPILKYSDILLIESTLQHVLRNTVTYSKSVWTSLSSEERAMMLEPYSLSFDGGVTTGLVPKVRPGNPAPALDVPLLDCVANEVVGYYGNCMLMPFSIPPAVAAPLQTSTGDLEDALLRFHQQGAPKQCTRVALPTRGVLGEAMLGHCSSGEKIDLTRFWNWQDSPADAAPQIQPVSVPNSAVSTLASAQTPNVLSGVLSSLGTAATAATVAPSTDGLALALAQKAPAASVADLSGTTQLAQLLASTQTTANQARQDALASQTNIIKDTIDQAAAIISAYLSGSKSSSSSSASPSSSKSSSSASSSGGGGTSSASTSTSTSSGGGNPSSSTSPSSSSSSS